MLGDKIKNLRKNKNLTQIQLSEKIGIAQSTLGMIESNKRPAGRKTLIKLAEFFGVTVDYLLSENDDKEAILKEEKSYKEKEIETIAAHLEDKNLTPKKVKLLKDYIDALFDDDEW